MKTTKRAVAMLLAATLLAVMLSACGSGGAGHDGASVPAGSQEDAAGTAGTDQEEDPAAGENSYTPPFTPPDTTGTTGTGQAGTEDPAIDVNAYTPSLTPPDTGKDSKIDPPIDPLAAIAGKDMASAETIAVLAALEGDQALNDFINSINGVNIDRDHNPYDLSWHYGDPETFKAGSKGDGNWGALYQAYVDACDWSLIFDADYYMARFPMLAELYHHDKALLLEHFQTAGVHEGRIGKASFCPDEYTENCSSELSALFGDAWECYAFYYMLNYDTEKSADTAKKSDSCDWLCVELSRTQRKELEHVNAYRAEVGAEPLDVHPELVAMANFRAWTDAYNGIEAHDWLDMPGNQEKMYTYMEWMGIHKFGENTVKRKKAHGPIISATYLNYRNSESHYKAMVSKDQQDFGTSNCYWSAHTTDVAVSFDVFSDTLCPANTLKK